jgi:hypothetical protein
MLLAARRCTGSLVAVRNGAKLPMYAGRQSGRVAAWGCKRRLVHSKPHDEEPALARREQMVLSSACPTVAEHLQLEGASGPS